jgi:hypothetical protein
MPTYYTAATLMVAAVYCVWRAWAQTRLQQHQLLCQRVAYMLWIAAHEGETGYEEDEAADDELERRLTTFTFLHRRHH